MKNRLYTSAFNVILAELMVNDTQDSLLLRIISYFLINRTNGMSYTVLLFFSIQQLIQWLHCGSIFYCHCCCFCSIFDFKRKSTKMWRVSVLKKYIDANGRTANGRCSVKKVFFFCHVSMLWTLVDLLCTKRLFSLETAIFPDYFTRDKNGRSSFSKEYSCS